MAVAYRQRQQPAPPDQVARLEQRVGALPAAYRDYLLQQDGGRLADNTEAAKTIFGVGDLPDWASMWEALDTYADRVPPWLVPVAEDEYGNLFAISLRDEDKGSVWFWDHEGEGDEDDLPTDDNIELRAKDWPGFLASLEPLELRDE